MVLWKSKVEHVPTVSWYRMFLPDTDPSETDLIWYGRVHNRDQKSMMKVWLTRRKLKADHDMTMIHTSSGMKSAQELINVRKHRNRQDGK